MRVLRWLGILALVVVGLWLLGILFILVSRPFDCAKMPNGFLIGRATVFSSLVGVTPDLVIRYPDGRIFSRGDNIMYFWDDVGFGGRFVGRNASGGLDHLDKFVYLNAIGLVTQDAQPELYRQLHEPRSREWSAQGKPRDTNLFHVYSSLREHPEYRKSWCKTDWFLPDE